MVATRAYDGRPYALIIARQKKRASNTMIEFLTVENGPTDLPIRLTANGVTVPEGNLQAMHASRPGPAQPGGAEGRAPDHQPDWSECR
jgi:hypothetical protein